MARLGGRHYLAFLAALAGCQAGGLLWPDLSEATKKTSPGEEDPSAAASQEKGRPEAAEAAEPGKSSTGPEEAGAAGKAPDTSPEASPEPSETPALTEEDGGETPRPAEARAGRAGTAPSPATAPRADTKPGLGETPEPADTVAAGTEPAAAATGTPEETASGLPHAGEAASISPGVERKAPVAEPPKGSSFWFYFLVALVMAFVGAAAWFFLQPPWKRGRWWRLFKAYVRDWRSGGAEETPPRGSPSIGLFATGRPGRTGATANGPGEGGGSEGLSGDPRERETGPETSLHLEDLSGDDTVGRKGKPNASSRYGAPLKPRDTTSISVEDVAREVAAAADKASEAGASPGGRHATKGSKSGKDRRTRRKRTTNITLPVISRAQKKRKEG